MSDRDSHQTLAVASKNPRNDLAFIDIRLAPSTFSSPAFFQAIHLSTKLLENENNVSDP